MKHVKQKDPVIIELEAKVSRLTAERDGAIELSRETADKASQGIADSVKVKQQEKQLRIIGHIAADRKAEAITEILTPLPISFAIDVRFADDATKLKAEDEIFERLKSYLQEILAHAKMKRTPTDAGLGVDQT